MKNLRLLSCAALSALIISGCTPTNTVRGNIVEDYRLAEVQPGVDTRTDVLRKLGSPTTRATFDDNIWYYIGQETEKRGILDPEVVEERVIVAFFSEDGILQEIKDIDNERLDIPYARRETPTSGNEITVLQQFLGNLGRFNTEEPPQ